MAGTFVTFTESVRRAPALAQQEAQQFGQNFIDAICLDLLSVVAVLLSQEDWLRVDADTEEGVWLLATLLTALILLQSL